MLIRLLTFMLCALRVLGCDPRCSCDSGSTSCNPWTMSAFPSGIPSTTTTLNMDNQLLQNLSSLDCNQYPKLRLLYVRNNVLSFINDTDFDGCSALTFLYLTNNSIATIGTEAFRSTPSLIYLSLKKNSIAEIGNNTMAHLSRLLELYLDENMISDIGFIPHLSSTVYLLSLNNNTLVDIKHGTFDGMRNMRFIFLGSNQIATMDDEVFKNLYLHELFLDGNLLTIVQAKSFFGTVSIMTLNLQNNLIDTIQKDTFKDIPYLYDIYLDGNNISSLDFLHNISWPISTLSLAHNKVTHISPSYFSRINYVDWRWLYLDLNNNPVSCDVQKRPEPVLNFTFLQWAATNYDIKGPEACIVTPKRQNKWDSNIDSIEILFFNMCYGHVSTGTCTDTCSSRISYLIIFIIKHMLD